MRIPTIGVVLAVWGPFSAFSADDPTEIPKEPQQGAVWLQAGDRAPFAGMLVPVELAARLTAKIEGCEARINLIQDRAQELAELEKSHFRDLRLKERETHKIKVELLQGALADAQISWWEHPGVWYAFGMGSAIVLVVGSVSILGQATR